MKFCIISDIHANLEALEAALKEIEAHKPDSIICLGDVVGYGASPNECCELVQSVSDATVMGNHDAVVAGLMDTGSYYPAVNRALQWTIDNLADRHFGWISSLPHALAYKGLKLSHGAPLYPELFDYIFTQGQAMNVFLDTDPDDRIFLLGHSHICKTFQWSGGSVREIVSDEFSTASGRFVISVGSIGQPRDSDPRGCFAIYDDVAGMFSFHRFAYDIKLAGKRILDAGLPPEFAMRLAVGM